MSTTYQDSDGDEPGTWGALDGEPPSPLPVGIQGLTVIDSRLREAGYRIHARRRGQEPVWRAPSGELLTQGDALLAALEEGGITPCEPPPLLLSQS